MLVERLGRYERLWSSRSVRGRRARPPAVAERHSPIKGLHEGHLVVQMVSALLRYGPQYIRTLTDNVRRWMEEHEYESVAQLTGSMSLARCPEPSAYERANYMTLLQSFHGEP